MDRADGRHRRICGGAGQSTGQVRAVGSGVPNAERIYFIEDNWSIHNHSGVLGVLYRWPRITPVWLPTYAPWLNPIEKLWRWFRQIVLTRHRLAGDWEAPQTRVNAFFAQFANGSDNLLRYVGLLGRANWLTGFTPNRLPKLIVITDQVCENNPAESRR